MPLISEYQKLEEEEGKEIEGVFPNPDGEGWVSSEYWFRRFEQKNDLPIWVNILSDDTCDIALKIEEISKTPNSEATVTFEALNVITGKEISTPKEIEKIPNLEEHVNNIVSELVVRSLVKIKRA